jgi:uncharacterized protein (DUF58 family)
MQSDVAQAHEPEDIQGLRDYQSSDAFRHIDWNASARSGGLVSREWGGEQATSTYALDWDHLDSLSTRQKQETLTAWVIDLFSEQQQWSLQLPQEKIKVGKDWQHRQHCLMAIAEVDV